MNQGSFALPRVAGLAVCLVGLMVGLPPAARAAEEAKVAKQSLRTPSGLDLDVVGELKGFTLDLTAEALAAGLDVITLRLTRAAAETPPPLTIKWAIPSHDVAGQWTPTRHFDKGVKP